VTESRILRRLGPRVRKTQRERAATGCDSDLRGFGAIPEPVDVRVAADPEQQREGASDGEDYAAEQAGETAHAGHCARTA
jgi:hypothetical protein